MTRLASLLSLLFLVSFSSKSDSLPASIAEECTTNESIFFPSKIRTTISETALKKEAIMLALGTSTSEPSFGTTYFKGQWFYEYSVGNVIFSGYKVRSHYLKTAIIINDKYITTILCDSENMNQDSNSIHRKSPQWKSTLNTRIKIELGKVSNKSPIKITDTYIKQITELNKKGLITNEELKTIKERIKKRYSE